MTMSVQEIARSYSEAADKGAQIGILADLNDCDKDQIIVVLKGQGITDIPATAKRGRKPGGHNSTPKSNKKVKATVVNALLCEGIKAIDVEINALQKQLDIYKRKKKLLTQALEMEDYCDE